MSERMIYECGDCGMSVVVVTTDFQEVGGVLCDCTKMMDYQGLENE
jgi:DNA-directed RNA polymerase subunit RPC12/RpoP